MPKRQPGFSPSSIANNVNGIGNNSWSQLGDGPWSGTVWVDGLEWEVEELPTSWRATSSAAQVISAPGLEQLLKKLVGRS